MQEPYLEVTFRHGRPLAAYYHLPHENAAKSARSRQVEPGLVIDYSESGQPLGVEITAPRSVSLETFNAVLEELGATPIGEVEFAPLHAP